MRRHIGIKLLLMAAAITTADSLASAAFLSVTNLADAITNPSPNSSTAIGVNRFGKTVVRAFANSGRPSNYPVIYDLSLSAGPAFAFASYPPDTNSLFPAGINDSGTIVGYYQDSDGNTSPFYSSGNALLASPVSFGGSYAQANAISNNNTMVGYATRSGGLQGRPFVTTGVNTANPITYNLGDLHPNPNTSNTSSANGISNTGLVVGTVSRFQGVYDPSSPTGSNDGNGRAALQAFVQRPLPGGGYATDSEIPIGTLLTAPGAFPNGTTYVNGQSLANGVNDHDYVVGSSDSDAGVRHGFVWSPVFGMKDLGNLPTAVQFAGSASMSDINNNGVAVGSSVLNFTATGTHAVMYRVGTSGPTMVDLNSLIDPASGWVLTQANSINNKNQIVGTGLHNGVNTAFAMTVPLVSAAIVRSGLTLPSDGFLDVANNTLIVRDVTEKQARDQVAAWYNGGSLREVGIGSSLAGDVTGSMTTLAVMPNDNLVGGPLVTSINGVATAYGDVFIKYAYFGDTNLDGKVDTTDLANLINGLRQGLTGWRNGDTNYDNVVDGADYANLLTSARLQSTPLDGIYGVDSSSGVGGAIP